MGNSKNEAAEIAKWESGARSLLVATADRVEISPPARILDDPSLLFDVFQDLLDSISVEDISDEELYTLTSQIAALVAQVLITENGAQWILEEDTRSISAGNYVLSRRQEGSAAPYRVDPFLMAKTEIESEEFEMSRLVDQARTLITWNL
ncbi:hypothetical protein [Saccharopolyspora sp. NPDC002376]